MLAALLSFTTALVPSVTLDEAHGVSDDERSEIMRAIEEGAASRNAEDAGALTVRIIGIPSRVRVIAELPSKEGGEPRRSQVDLQRGPEGKEMWRPLIAEMLAAIFGGEMKPQPAEIEKSAPPPLRERPERPIEVERPQVKEKSMLPWLLFGGSAAAVTAGAILGAVSHSAAEEGTRSMDPVRVAELDRKVFATGLSADILFAVAAGALIAGVVTLVTE